MTESKELLRVSDLATQMGVSAGRVYQLVRAGELPSVRVGGAIRIPKDAWRAWLDQQRDRALNSVRHV
jgi:excisionase family DNA binding protein